MRKNYYILIALAIVGLWYAKAYAVQLEDATNVQLLVQFLMPTESVAKQNKALVGARFRLNLADTTSVAVTVEAMRQEFRKWLRDGYLAKQQSLNQMKYRAIADSVTTADMWGAQ